MQKLLLATNNKGKITEFRSLLEGIPYSLITPQDMGIHIEVKESGKTYKENAALKASAFGEASGLLTLADDSGLEVYALRGEPGIMSSRYAGPGASDKERVSYLLSHLKDVPAEKRTARFKCVIAIYIPSGKIEICEGECEGIIVLEPRGTEGFGYDPVFYFPELGKTMAELPMEVKNRVSHRGKAAQKARNILRKLVSSIQ